MPDRTISLLGGVLGLSVALGGCVVSVEPLVSESDAAFDARILGAWEETTGSDRARLSRLGERAYAIEFTSGGKTGRLEGRLGQLGDQMVLSAWPTPRADEIPQPYGDLLVTGHLNLVLEIGLDEIRTWMIDPDSLAAALAADRVRLTHRRAGDRLVLQGGTEELRSALSAHLGRAGSLTEPRLWRRAGHTQSLLPVEVPCFEASAWREADRLFRRDGYWVGADGASSVDLGEGRTLWLFGDTWIDPSGKGTRHGAHMVSNSVAIQHGTDPTAAQISFYAGKSADGKPAAFFPDRDAEALWPGAGVRVGDRVVLFLARTLRTGVALGFEHLGWTALMVENPDAAPPNWRIRPLETPENSFGVLLGYTAVLRLGDYVYALGAQDPAMPQQVYVARWPVDLVRSGSLLHPEWWAGDRLGWVPDSSTASRRPLFQQEGTEASIHVDGATQRLLLTQTHGFPAADVTLRAAPGIAGPWSARRMVYRPPEYYHPNATIYAGKAHPQLSGADLVLTYATNSLESAGHLTDPGIYYPRFVRLTRC